MCSVMTPSASSDQFSLCVKWMLKSPNYLEAKFDTLTNLRAESSPQFAHMLTCKIYGDATKIVIVVALI